MRTVVTMQRARSAPDESFQSGEKGLVRDYGSTPFTLSFFTFRIAIMPAITSDTSAETCPDCRVQLAPVVSTKHPYFGCSASCWAVYTEILAREYSSLALMKSVHRLTVDAYAAQHPGKTERRTIQSVWVHLAGLYLILERGLANDFATRVIGALTKEAEPLIWLTPPERLGSVTVIDVVEASGAMEHEEAVRRWAHDVWEAWKPHHKRVQARVSRILTLN